MKGTLRIPVNNKQRWLFTQLRNFKQRIRYRYPWVCYTKTRPLGWSLWSERDHGKTTNGGYPYRTTSETHQGSIINIRTDYRNRCKMEPAKNTWSHCCKNTRNILICAHRRRKLPSRSTFRNKPKVYDIRVIRLPRMDNIAPLPKHATSNVNLHDLSGVQDRILGWRGAKNSEAPVMYFLIREAQCRHIPGRFCSSSRGIRTGFNSTEPRNRYITVILWFP